MDQVRISPLVSLSPYLYLIHPYPLYQCVCYDIPVDGPLGLKVHEIPVYSSIDQDETSSTSTSVVRSTPITHEPSSSSSLSVNTGTILSNESVSHTNTLSKETQIMILNIQRKDLWPLVTTGDVLMEVNGYRTTTVQSIKEARSSSSSSFSSALRSLTNSSVSNDAEQGPSVASSSSAAVSSSSASSAVTHPSTTTTTTPPTTIPHPPIELSLMHGKVIFHAPPSPATPPLPTPTVRRYIQANELPLLLPYLRPITIRNPFVYSLEFTTGLSTLYNGFIVIDPQQELPRKYHQWYTQTYQPHKTDTDSSISVASSERLIYTGFQHLDLLVGIGTSDRTNTHSLSTPSSSAPSTNRCATLLHPVEKYEGNENNLFPLLVEFFRCLVGSSTNLQSSSFSSPSNDPEKPSFTKVPVYVTTIPSAILQEAKHTFASSTIPSSTTTLSASASSSSDTLGSSSSSSSSSSSFSSLLDTLTNSSPIPISVPTLLHLLQHPEQHKSTAQFSSPLFLQPSLPVHQLTILRSLGPVLTNYYNETIQELVKEDTTIPSSALQGSNSGGSTSTNPSAMINTVIGYIRMQLLLDRTSKALPLPEDPAALQELYTKTTEKDTFIGPYILLAALLQRIFHKNLDPTSPHAVTILKTAARTQAKLDYQMNNNNRLSSASSSSVASIHPRSSNPPTGAPLIRYSFRPMLNNTIVPKSSTGERDKSIPIKPKYNRIHMGALLSKHAAANISRILIQDTSITHIRAGCFGIDIIGDYLEDHYISLPGVRARSAFESLRVSCYQERKLYAGEALLSSLATFRHQVQRSIGSTESVTLPSPMKDSSAIGINPFPYAHMGSLLARQIQAQRSLLRMFRRWTQEQSSDRVRRGINHAKQDLEKRKLILHQQFQQFTNLRGQIEKNKLYESDPKAANYYKHLLIEIEKLSKALENIHQALAAMDNHASLLKTELQRRMESERNRLIKGQQNRFIHSLPGYPYIPLYGWSPMVGNLNEYTTEDPYYSGSSNNNSNSNSNSNTNFPTNGSGITNTTSLSPEKRTPREMSETSVNATKPQRDTLVNDRIPPGQTPLPFYIPGMAFATVVARILARSFPALSTNGNEDYSFHQRRIAALLGSPVLSDALGLVTSTNVPLSRAIEEKAQSFIGTLPNLVTEELRLMNILDTNSEFLSSLALPPQLVTLLTMLSKRTHRFMYGELVPKPNETTDNGSTPDPSVMQREGQETGATVQDAVFEAILRLPSLSTDTDGLFPEEDGMKDNPNRTVTDSSLAFLTLPLPTRILRHGYPFPFLPTRLCRLASASIESRCLTNYRTAIPYIQCGTCGQWLHWSCTGLPRSDMQYYDIQFRNSSSMNGGTGNSNGGTGTTVHPGKRYFRCSICCSPALLQAFEEHLQCMRTLINVRAGRALFALSLTNTLRLYRSGVPSTDNSSSSSSLVKMPILSGGLDPIGHFMVYQLTNNLATTDYYVGNDDDGLLQTRIGTLIEAMKKDTVPVWDRNTENGSTQDANDTMGTLASPTVLPSNDVSAYAQLCIQLWKRSHNLSQYLLQCIRKRSPDNGTDATVEWLSTNLPKITDNYCITSQPVEIKTVPKIVPLPSRSPPVPATFVPENIPNPSSPWVTDQAVPETVTGTTESKPINEQLDDDEANDDEEPEDEVVSEASNTMEDGENGDESPDDDDMNETDGDNDEGMEKNDFVMEEDIDILNDDDEEGAVDEEETTERMVASSFVSSAKNTETTTLVSTDSLGGPTINQRPRRSTQVQASLVKRRGGKATWSRRPLPGKLPSTKPKKKTISTRAFNRRRKKGGNKQQSKKTVPSSVPTDTSKGDTEQSTTYAGYIRVVMDIVAAEESSVGYEYTVPTTDDYTSLYRSIYSGERNRQAPDIRYDGTVIRSSILLSGKNRTRRNYAMCARALALSGKIIVDTWNPESPSNDEASINGAVERMLDSSHRTNGHEYIKSIIPGDPTTTTTDTKIDYPTFVSTLYKSLSSDERKFWTDAASSLWTEYFANPLYLEVTVRHIREAVNDSINSQKALARAYGYTDGTFFALPSTPVYPLSAPHLHSYRIPLPRFPFTALSRVTASGPAPPFIIQEGGVPAPRTVQFGKYAGVQDWLLLWLSREVLRMRQTKLEEQKRHDLEIQTNVELADAGIPERTTSATMVSASNTMETNDVVVTDESTTLPRTAIEIPVRVGPSQPSSNDQVHVPSHTLSSSSSSSSSSTKPTVPSNVLPTDDVHYRLVIDDQYEETLLPEELRPWSRLHISDLPLPQTVFEAKLYAYVKGWLCDARQTAENVAPGSTKRRGPENNTAVTTETNENNGTTGNNNTTTTFAATCGAYARKHGLVYVDNALPYFVPTDFVVLTEELMHQFKRSPSSTTTTGGSRSGKKPLSASSLLSNYVSSPILSRLRAAVVTVTRYGLRQRHMNMEKVYNRLRKVDTAFTQIFTLYYQWMNQYGDLYLNGLPLHISGLFSDVNVLNEMQERKYALLQHPGREIEWIKQTLLALRGQSTYIHDMFQRNNITMEAVPHTKPVTMAVENLKVENDSFEARKERTKEKGSSAAVEGTVPGSKERKYPARGMDRKEEKKGNGRIMTVEDADTEDNGDVSVMDDEEEVADEMMLTDAAANDDGTGNNGTVTNIDWGMDTVQRNDGIPFTGTEKDETVTNEMTLLPEQIPKYASHTGTMFGTTWNIWNTLYMILDAPSITIETKQKEEATTEPIINNAPPDSNHATANAISAKNSHPTNHPIPTVPLLNNPYISSWTRSRIIPVTNIPSREGMKTTEAPKAEGRKVEENTVRNEYEESVSNDTIIVDDPIQDLRNDLYVQLSHDLDLYRSTVLTKNPSVSSSSSVLDDNDTLIRNLVAIIPTVSGTPLRGWWLPDPSNPLVAYNTIKNKLTRHKQDEDEDTNTGTKSSTVVLHDTLTKNSSSNREEEEDKEGNDQIMTISGRLISRSGTSKHMDTVARVLAAAAQSGSTSSCDVDKLKEALQEQQAKGTVNQALLARTTPTGLCLRPGCTVPALLSSKYCSSVCGMLVARARLLSSLNLVQEEMKEEEQVRNDQRMETDTDTVGTEEKTKKMKKNEFARTLGAYFPSTVTIEASTVLLRQLKTKQQYLVMFGNVMIRYIQTVLNENSTQLQILLDQRRQEKFALAQAKKQRRTESRSTENTASSMTRSKVTKRVAVPVAPIEQKIAGSMNLRIVDSVTDEYARPRLSLGGTSRRRQQTVTEKVNEGGVGKEDNGTNAGASGNTTVLMMKDEFNDETSGVSIVTERGKDTDALEENGIVIDNESVSPSKRARTDDDGTTMTIPDTDGLMMEMNAVAGITDDTEGEGEEDDGNAEERKDEDEEQEEGNGSNSGNDDEEIVEPDDDDNNNEDNNTNTGTDTEMNDGNDEERMLSGVPNHRTVVERNTVKDTTMDPMIGENSIGVTDPSSSSPFSSVAPTLRTKRPYRKRKQIDTNGDGPDNVTNSTNSNTVVSSPHSSALSSVFSNLDCPSCLKPQKITNYRTHLLKCTGRSHQYSSTLPSDLVYVFEKRWTVTATPTSTSVVMAQADTATVLNKVNFRCNFPAYCDNPVTVPRWESNVGSVLSVIPKEKTNGSSSVWSTVIEKLMKETETTKDETMDTDSTGGNTKSTVEQRIYGLVFSASNPTVGTDDTSFSAPSSSAAFRTLSGCSNVCTQCTDHHGWEIHLLNYLDFENKRLHALISTTELSVYGTIVSPIPSFTFPTVPDTLRLAYGLGNGSSGTGVGSGKKEGKLSANTTGSTDMVTGNYPTMNESRGDNTNSLTTMSTFADLSLPHHYYRNALYGKPTDNSSGTTKTASLSFTPSFDSTHTYDPLRKRMYDMLNTSLRNLRLGTLFIDPSTVERNPQSLNTGIKNGPPVNQLPMITKTNTLQSPDIARTQSNANSITIPMPNPTVVPVLGSTTDTRSSSTTTITTTTSTANNGGNNKNGTTDNEDSE